MNSDRIWTLLARKLAEEISPEELSELEVLLKESPHVHLEIQALEESWHKMDDRDNEDDEAVYQHLTEKLKGQGFNICAAEDSDGTGALHAHRSKRSKQVKWLVAVSTLVVVAGLGIIFLFFNTGSKAKTFISATSSNSISTNYGSRSKVELPDGSVVWLNSGSKLTYDKQFGVALREVNLTGEGFFDVVHNAEKPFIIHTAFFNIKDLGTRFNVKCYPEDKTTETSLIEGSVEVTSKKNPARKFIPLPDYKLILPNEEVKTDSIRIFTGRKNNRIAEELSVNMKKLTYQAEDSFAVETAWTYNKLSFDDEAFTEVAKKMERWFDKKIEFRNKKLEDIHLTVSFTTESFEQAMDALKYTNRFDYEIKDGKAIIY